MITNEKVITVFNGRTDKETRRKIYIPTVIRGVSCAEAKGATITNNGVWSSDVQYKIRIPLDAEIQDQRSYLSCRQYEKLDSAKVLEHWTIAKTDLVIREAYTGNVFLLYEDELTAYAQEHGIDLIRITEYADNTSGGSLYLRHWRIGGK